MSSAEESSPPRSRSHSRLSKPPSQPPQPKRTQSTTSYFTYPVSHVVSGLYRRLTEPPPEKPSRHDPMTTTSGVFTPPRRTASPFQPPPLTPLTLKTTPNTSHQLLTRALAEEIRLLVPPRLQLVDTWQLAYSLDRDGSALSTLYDKCETFSHRSQRAGYVLVVKDSSSTTGDNNGTLFGAYLSDPPHPDSHYYGTGECFLWRASTLPGTPVLQVDANGRTVSGGKENGVDGVHSHEALKVAGLPPPPSADTTNLRGRNIAIRGEEQTGGDDGTSEVYESTDTWTGSPGELLSLSPAPAGRRTASASPGAGGIGIDIPIANPGGAKTGESRSGISTPDQIRFKAFPYSGVNDYMIFCETGFLSVGGGDGHFGLWLDDSFEKGVSSPCLTFGNEPLSDEGTKFDVLGVEVWYIGS